MLTFRIAITAAVMAFVTALTACLIFIQIATFHSAARAAASAAMDAASANTLSRLEAEVSELSTLVRVLSTNPSLADSDDRSEVDGAIGLFKAALHELPLTDSLYVGYNNGCWLQVRRLDVLDPTERQKLGAPPGAVHNVNLVRPTLGGALPMRRIFEDEQGNKIDQLDLWDYGYDARTRAWYRDTMQADRALVSSPYASFSIGTPMITLSAPLQGHVRGVIATDLKLDKFSDLVYAQHPGERGTALIFDSFGVLIAHPDFARLMDYAMTHPSHPQLPEISEIRGGRVGAVMRRWDGSDHYDGNIRDENGRDYLFRFRRFSLADKLNGYSLLIAAENDFVKNVRTLQIRGIIIALIADNPLFLQVKQANASVLEAYAGESAYPHHGQRVVMGQQLMQPASDLFLGWVTGPEGRHFYIRQLRDVKLSPLVETYDAEMLSIYGQACGWVLARTHAKAGDPWAISGYLGKNAQFDEAMGKFALAYADQAEKDHAALKGGGARRYHRRAAGALNCRAAVG
jgi:hypothetical protein